MYRYMLLVRDRACQLGVNKTSYFRNPYMYKSLYLICP